MGRRTRRLVIVTLALWVLVLSTDTAAASNVATGLQGEGRDLQVPTWLYLFTGGAAVGASGLLAMFVTDRRLIVSLHAWRRSAVLGETLVRPLRYLAGSIAVVGSHSSSTSDSRGRALPTPTSPFSSSSWARARAW